ncbi:MAG: ParB-like nuclease domain-containing protein [Candidatus Omnitrophica bacterium]|nr:ParB-like nuclease domain-containing protein [Candidatus Omnitrophota bacterium]
MGSVKEYLFRKELKDRELHNSRLFVDLCENIHIHYREYRLMFSLDEYYEFYDIITRSTHDVRNYLTQNLDYKEKAYPTTLMVACGGDRQKKFLKNSPFPNESFHDNNVFAIELQEENITDEIHVHYRDFRLALNRENFKDIAKGFAGALAKLEEFETNNNYKRSRHPDREIENFNNEDLGGDDLVGSSNVEVAKITSPWHKDIEEKGVCDHKYVKVLCEKIRNGEYIPPILLSKNPDKEEYCIVNGHHRYLAHKWENKKLINCIILEMSLEQTDDLRSCERSIKKFDKLTNYRFGFTTFMNEFMAHKMNRYYRNDYKKRISLKNRLKIFIKRLLKRPI